MPQELPPPTTRNLSPRGRWLVFIAAFLGWMFDGFEMGLFPLVAKPALADLLGTNDETQIVRWLAVITAVFLIGAATGGVLFGWLGDRIGRVRAMIFSVVTYALFGALCGFANEAWQVAALRFVASLGMGGEWALGIALVMEVWPNQSRPWLAGWIGAAANFGFLFIALVGLGLNAVISDLGRLLLDLGVSAQIKDRLVSHSGWRILMLVGALPALLTFLIRLFVPESQRWEMEKRGGATAHWETRDLLGVLIGAAAACGMVALLATELPWPVRVCGALAALMVVLAGYLYPVRRYLQRLSATGSTTASDNRATLRRMLLGAVLSGIPLISLWGTIQQLPSWVSSLPNGDRPQARAYVQIAAAIGAIIGCVAATTASERFGRRNTYSFLCGASLLSIFALFGFNSEYGTPLLIWAFVAGGITTGLAGWLALYLPELFRTRVRATGQGFSYNFGRIFAAIGVMQLPVIMTQAGVGFGSACPTIALIYLLGMIVIWLAPETRGQPLPDDLPESGNRI
jgi:MFS family permease